MVTRQQAPPGRDPQRAVRRYAHLHSASRAAACIRAHAPAEAALPEAALPEAALPEVRLPEVPLPEACEGDLQMITSRPDHASATGAAR